MTRAQSTTPLLSESDGTTTHSVSVITHTTPLQLRRTADLSGCWSLSNSCPNSLCLLPMLLTWLQMFLFHSVGNPLQFSSVRFLFAAFAKVKKLHHHRKSLAFFPPHPSQKCINRAPPSQCRGGGGIGGRCRGGYVTSERINSRDDEGGAQIKSCEPACHIIPACFKEKAARCWITQPWPAHKVGRCILSLFNWAAFSHNSN